MTNERKRPVGAGMGAIALSPARAAELTQLEQRRADLLARLQSAFPEEKEALVRAIQAADDLAKLYSSPTSELESINEAVLILEDRLSEAEGPDEAQDT